MKNTHPHFSCLLSGCFCVWASMSQPCLCPQGHPLRTATGVFTPAPSEPGARDQLSMENPPLKQIIHDIGATNVSLTGPQIFPMCPLREMGPLWGRYLPSFLPLVRTFSLVDYWPLPLLPGGKETEKVYPILHWGNGLQEVDVPVTKLQKNINPVEGWEKEWFSGQVFTWAYLGHEPFIKVLKTSFCEPRKADFWQVFQDRMLKS